MFDMNLQSAVSKHLHAGSTSAVQLELSERTLPAQVSQHKLQSSTLSPKGSRNTEAAGGLAVSISVSAALRDRGIMMCKHNLTSIRFHQTECHYRLWLYSDIPDDSDSINAGQHCSPAPLEPLLWSVQQDVIYQATWVHTTRASAVFLCNSSCYYYDYHQIVKPKQHKLLQEHVSAHSVQKPTVFQNKMDEVDFLRPLLQLHCTRPLWPRDKQPEPHAVVHRGFTLESRQVSIPNGCPQESLS